MPELSAIATMFGNRVAKNAKHRHKWARRAAPTLPVPSTDAYRLYDQDIPEVPVTVDWYGGQVVMADVRAFTGEDPGRDEAWLVAMVQAAQQALALSDGTVHVKRRERMRDRQAGHQYERTAAQGVWRTVDEHGHTFWVNLSDYLDTGLFLDHRLTRARFAAEAGAARVLNLFAYTGAFTVWAAKAGARSSVSVDLSNTYGDWARRNWEANAIDEAAHAIWTGEVREFLTSYRGAPFDLAIVDPPTFSNSKRMDYTWDVQRDHGALLTDVARHMRRGGVIWFSTNRRRFVLDRTSLPGGTVADDLTARTLPDDFRDRKVHHAFRLSLP